jgi:MSHA biogenesis protein MshN
VSLVNKMLRDLDQRRASELEKDGVSRHVRTLPPTQALAWKGPLLAVVGGMVGAAAVWLAMSWTQSGHPPPVRAEAGVELPAPLPPLPTSTEPVEAPRSPAKVEPAPARNEIRRSETNRIGRTEPSLKLDRSLLGGAKVPTVAKPVAERPASDTAAPAARIEKQLRAPAASEASDVEYRKGMNAIKRGDAAEASSALSAALRIDATHAQARQALLSVLVGQKQWDEALKVGADGLALDPKQNGWAVLVARLYVERGDRLAAIKILDEHAQYAERDADYQGFYALLLQQAKRPAEAVDHYRSALALKPGEGRWWYGLGLALEASQRAAEARDAYTQARVSANLPADLAAAVEQKLKSP